MKTSSVLFALICINTCVLLSEQITYLLNDISPLWFLFVESALILGYSVHSLIKDSDKLTDTELTELKTLLTKNLNK